MSYPNMNPAIPMTPVNHRSQDTAPMHRASKHSNRNSRTVHKAADQMPSRPLAIPAIHMATPTAIRMDIRTVIRMVTTRIAIATTVASGSR